MRLFVPISLIGIAILSGCAEGPLWTTGKYVPWVNRQWAEEEKVAETIIAKRKRLRTLVKSAQSDGSESQEQAAQELLQIVKNDPIHLMKIEAVNLLPLLNGPTALEALQLASMDSASDVRLAAIRGLQQKAAPASAALVARIAQSDNDLDVRIAATKALAVFNGNEVLQALNQSLTDSNPAIQVIAMNSLQSVTGQAMERDVNLWRNYVAGQLGENSQTAQADSNTQFK